MKVRKAMFLVIQGWPNSILEKCIYLFGKNIALNPLNNLYCFTPYIYWVILWEAVIKNDTIFICFRSNEAGGA